MAANKSVIVLAPNGRRQNVKVTLNTTILQVLEEVCQKQGYNVDDYDIKHVHRKLDLNTTFRFTGLPNNAQLEMVACTRLRRAATNVTIGIQPEDGKRIMREFSPNTTLAQALTDIYPDSDLERAVLIYMHSEVCGKEALDRTTLKSLGLNSGKAIIRLIYRDPERLKTQAHVSTPLLPKLALAVDSWSDSCGNSQSSSWDSSRSNKNSERVPSPTSHCSKTTDDVTLSATIVSNINSRSEPADEMNVSIGEIKMDVIEETILDGNADKEKMDVEDKQIDTRNEGKSQEMDTSVVEESRSIASTVKDHITERDQTVTEVCRKRNQEDTYKIEFLGERNALVFNQAGTQALQRDELPDSFFELDLHDAKALLRDAKLRREQLESAPLLTEAQRQLDRDKRMLDQLNKYRRTVIRIQFPDQFVLQGLFMPLESVQAVKDFITNYLDDPSHEFIIYTAPPKQILNPEARLIDENLVPSAIVYYSGQSSLKPSVKAKLTDPRAAGIEAVRSRTDTMRKEQDPMIKDEGGTVVENKIDRAIPGPSGGKSSSSSTAQNKNGKPKWFKL